MVGAAAFGFALVMLLKTLIFSKTGVRTKGEVLGSAKDDKGRYVHVVRYTAENGEVFEKNDSAG